jgi:uncharacterized protein
MAFYCCQCGECCSHMGMLHRIVEEFGDYEFLLNNQYTGEKKRVRVDTDKIPLFNDRSIFSEWPEACPFLRRQPDTRRAVCTVFQTWPEICKEFGCWRLLIIGPDGRRAGRIMYQRFFCAEDDALAGIWDRQVRTLDEPDDALWDEAVVRILTEAGYRVRK